MNVTMPYGEVWIEAEQTTEILAGTAGAASQPGFSYSEGQWLDPAITKQRVQQLEFLGDHRTIGDFVTAGTLATTGVSLLLHARRANEVGEPSYVLKIPSAYLGPAEDPAQPAEISVMSDLGEHPNIPTIVATGTVATQPDETARYWYYVTTEVEQGTLANHLPVHSEEQAQRVMSIMAGATKAAIHAHNKGYTHNDINESNIFVNGADGQLGDWGGAAHSGSSPRQLTLSRSPAEIVSGVSPATPESDTYALGTTLIRVLSGEAPSDSKRLVIEEVLEHPNRYFPRELVEVTAACVDTPPHRPTTPQLLAALTAHLN